MLYRHKEFLKNHCDFPEENIILIENGDVLELTQDRASVVEKREVGRTFIDETGFEEIDGEVVRERRQLAYDGVVTPVVTIDEESGELESEPEVVARGVLGMDGNGNSASLLRDMRRVVAETVANASRDERRDASVLKERVRLELKRYIQKQLGAKPVILPVVVQV
jgi:ribonuclease J